jgi:hypothetical protein
LKIPSPAISAPEPEEDCFMKFPLEVFSHFHKYHLTIWKTSFFGIAGYSQGQRKCRAMVLFYLNFIT